MMSSGTLMPPTQLFIWQPLSSDFAFEKPRNVSLPQKALRFNGVNCTTRTVFLRGLFGGWASAWVFWEVVSDVGPDTSGESQIPGRPQPPLSLSTGA